MDEALDMEVRTDLATAGIAVPTIFPHRRTVHVEGWNRTSGGA